MNKAYKVIYNETTGTYVAVAEIATSHTKSDATIVTTATNPQHTGPTGLRLKKMALSHLSVAALGVFSMMAMPAAHASWTNGSFGQNNGNNSIAIGSGSGSGQQAITNGDNAIAIGSGAKTNWSNSVAIGHETEANEWSTAIGYKSKAIGSGGVAIAIGYEALAESEGQNTAIAIGNNAHAVKSGIAIGQGAKAPQNAAVAIGWGADASNSKSGIAIGDRASANGTNALAIGGNANNTATFAFGQGAVALGSGSNSQGAGAVAIGGLGDTFGGSEALNDYAVAIGANAHARESGSIAIGGDKGSAAQANGIDSLAFGTGSQTAAKSVGGIAIGLNSKSDADYATAIGPWAQAMQDHSMAMGANAFANGTYAMAVGDRNLALKEEAIAVGLQNKVDGEKASSFGHRNLIESYHDLAIGHDNLLASSTLTNSTTGATMTGVNNAFGSENIIVGTENTATGNYNNIGGASYDEATLSKTANGNPLQNVTVNGNRNKVNSASHENTDTVVVGSTSTLFGTRNNTIGTYNRIGEGTVGDTTSFVEVTNANVLGSENIVKSNNSGIVGNNNTIDTGVTGSFILGNNVNIDANAAIISGTNKSTFDGSVVLGNNSAVQNTVDTHEYTIAGNTYQFAGANPVGTVSVGDIDSERTITNLAAGRISSDSTDAINGSQLYAIASFANSNSLHYLSVYDNGVQSGNYDNKGAAGANSIAIGVNTYTTKAATNAVAMGYTAQAIQRDALALGTNAYSSGQNAIAMGTKANVDGANAIAIGADTKSIGGPNVVIGRLASAGTSAISYIDATGTAVKHHNGLNVAIGVGSNAISYDYLPPVGSRQTTGSATAIGAFANATGGGSPLALGDQARAHGFNSVAIGGNANSAGTQADGDYSMALGAGAKATKASSNGVAVGNSALVSANNAFAFGVSASSSAANAIAFGAYTKSTGENAAAFGVNNQALADNVSILGSSNKVETANTGVVGSNNTISPNAPGTFIIGNHVNVTSAVSDMSASNGAVFNGSVALGNAVSISAPVGTNSYSFAGKTHTFAGAAPVGTVSIGSIGKERTMTNVAAGRISNSSTDAINGSQLYAAYDAIDDAYSAGLNFSDNKGNVSHRDLGQTLSIVGATVNPVTIAYDSTNAATVGTYSAQNIQTVTDSAGNIQIQFAERPVFDGVTLGDATKNLVTINEGGINVTGGGKTVVIAGDKVDFGGNTLTNVAPGAITSTSQDAVNGSQLYTVNELASKGWNIQTNGDTASQVHPGDTVDIGTAAGENNIKVTRNGNTIDFELNKNLDLGNTGSVVMGPTTINQDGLTIINGPSVTINGIDAGGKTLTNVAPGVNGTDGVNVDQLKDLDTSLTAAGLNFVGSDGVQVHRDLGTTLGIVGANQVSGTQYQGTVAGTAGAYSAKNIQTVTDPTSGNIQIQLAERPEFEGIKAGNTAGNIVNIDNSGINITGGGKTVVIAGDKVDFGGNTLTNVAPGAITSTSQDAVNGSQLYTVNELASKGWNIQTNGDTASQVHPGDTVDIGTAAGENNIKVTRNGNTIDFELNKNLDLGNTGSVVMGPTTINQDGLTIINGPSVTINGIDAGGKTLTNVAPGVNGTDGVNVDQLKDLDTSLTAAGLNFVGSDGVQVHRDLGTTLGIVGANQVSGTQYQGTVAGTAGAYSAKNIQTVTDPTSGNIQIQLAERPEFEGIKAGNTAGNIVNIDNSGINITGGGKTVVIAGDKVDFGGNTLTNVAPGAITSTSQDAVNGSQLYTVNELASKGWNIQTNGDTASQVHPGDTVDIGTAAGENNIKVTRNGNTIDFELNKNLDLGNTGSVVMGPTTINQDGLTIINGPSVTINGIDAGGKTLTNVAPGVNGTDGVNVDQLKDLDTSLTAAGLNFVGSDGVQVHRDLGTTLGIVGANQVSGTQYQGTVAGTAGAYSAKNIQTVTDPTSGNIQIQLAERPEFEGIKAGNTAGNIVNIDNSGINITGGGKTVVIAGDKVDFGGNTLTNVAPGAITSTSQDAVNGSQLYTVNELASKGWNIQTNGDTASQVHPGDTVDIGTAAGENNIKVTRNGNTIDFELNKNLDLGNTGSVVMGPTTINQDGLTIINGPSVTINGIDAGGKTLTNVAPGVNGTDGVNVDQLKDLGTSLTDAGLNFKDSAGNINHSKLGDTLSIVGATVNPINTITYDATTVATVSDYSAKNVQTVTDGKGNMQIQFAERPVFDGVTLGDATKNLVTINEGGINITGGSKTIVIEGDKVDFGGNTLTNVAPGAITSTSQDAVNGSQLYNVQAIASKGWNIQTNGDKASQVQPGDTVDIGTAAGENNIKVTRNGNTIDFELNKNLDLGNTGSVKMGDLTINNAGLVIKNGPSVTINGIDAGGKTITNVLPGKNGTDGVNVNQLNDLGNSLTAAGLNFVGSDGVQVHRDLGTTLGIVGANKVNGTQYQGTVAGTAGTYSAKNVQTVTDPTTGNIQIQLAERPEFEGIKAGNTAGNIVNIDNSGINITGGGKTVVIAGDKVDFGGNTLANVAPGAITNTSKDAVNGSQLYNVQAIASKGWNIQTNGDKASQVQPGDTVDIGTAAGENNIKVTRNGNTIDFELNKNLDLGNTGSVKMGDLTIDQAGLVIKNGPSITINGIDAGNKTITNMAPGVNGTDAVNVDQLDDVKNTAGKGWNIQTNGDKATQVKPGDTVDIGTTDGETNIQVSRNGNIIDFELNKNLDLGSTGSVVMGNTLLNNNGLTINGGPSITQNGIDAGNKTITNVAPGVGLTDAVNLSQLNQAITGAKYAGLRVENGSDIIAPNESLNIIGQGGTTVSYDKNTNTYTVSSKNGGTGTGSMDDWNVTGSDGKGGSVNVPITDGKNVDFAAGSKNVVVTPIQTADGAKVTVDVAQDLNLNSVTTKNADGSSTVVNGNGVTIKGKDGKNGASITQAGIDAGNQKITNVAAGTDATDAVNVSQLNAVSNNINNLSNRINEVEDNANAGTATAIAIANLPQAYEPGARVIAVAAGAYEGETGYAIGYSAISDGGNWIIKASGTGNSQQKFGAGAGVGYRWR